MLYRVSRRLYQHIFVCAMCACSRHRRCCVLFVDEGEKYLKIVENSLRSGIVTFSLSLSCVSTAIGWTVEFCIAHSKAILAFYMLIRAWISSMELLCCRVVQIDNSMLFSAHKSEEWSCERQIKVLCVIPQQSSRICIYFSRYIL